MGRHGQEGLQSALTAPTGQPDDPSPSVSVPRLEAQDLGHEGQQDQRVSGDRSIGDVGGTKDREGRNTPFRDPLAKGDSHLSALCNM